MLWSDLISKSFLECRWIFSSESTANEPSRFCRSSSPGLSLPLKSEPTTIGRRVSPCSKPTITSSSGCGSISSPRALPALGVAMRAHALSSLSESEGYFTRTRPSWSGSLLLVTTPTTSEADQSRSWGGRISSSRVREERPEIWKAVW